MAEIHDDRGVKRWDIHQRLQHILLLISFTLLMMTGMPLKFPDSPVSKVLMHIVGGAETAGKVHRTAAGILIFDAMYHLLYVISNIISGKNIWAIIPRWKDAQDLSGMLKYFLRLQTERPKFDRYTFTEKFEYWAVVWGSFVMIVTGSVMWFPVLATKVLPVITMDLSRVIHSYEALLAALAIIIWHFYHAHLSPDVFPMSQIWLTGRISEKELIHHHPLEYKRLKDSGELTGGKVRDTEGK